MDHKDKAEKKRGWFGRKAKDKAESKGIFGGYGTRQEQLEAMELGLQPSDLKKMKMKGK